METRGAGSPVVELHGNRRAVVDGCDGIVDYDSERVILRGGRLILRFSGRGLRLVRLTESSAIVEGAIHQVEYACAKAEGACPFGKRGNPAQKEEETMLEKAAHWLTGWIEMEIQGDGARFLNAAAKTGVEFWGFQRENGRLLVRGRPREYRTLRDLAQAVPCPPPPAQAGRAAFFYSPSPKAERAAPGRPGGRGRLCVPKRLLLGCDCDGRPAPDPGPGAAGRPGERRLPGVFSLWLRCQGRGNGDPK